MNISITGYACLLRETRMCSRRKEWLDSNVPPDAEEGLPDTWIEDAAPWLTALVGTVVSLLIVALVLGWFA